MLLELLFMLIVAYLINWVLLTVVLWPLFYFRLWHSQSERFNEAAEVNPFGLAFMIGLYHPLLIWESDFSKATNPFKKG